MSNIEWHPALSFEEIIYEKAEGIAKITINRPEVRNAFTPMTVKEMIAALDNARDDSKLGVIILCGKGDLAFCSGGDQRIRGDSGYRDEDDGVHRLNVLDFQRQIRTCPKPVIAMVAGYAIGGGHVLHMMCDITIAAENARFGQTGPRVGSFDGGYGASYMARIVGQKKAREIWYLCRQYGAQEAMAMGLVNTVVPLKDLESETLILKKELVFHQERSQRMERQNILQIQSENKAILFERKFQDLEIQYRNETEELRTQLSAYRREAKELNVENSLYITYLGHLKIEKNSSVERLLSPKLLDTIKALKEHNKN